MIEQWSSLISGRIIKVGVSVQVRERFGLPARGWQGWPGQSVQAGHQCSLWRIRLWRIRRPRRQTAGHLSQLLRQARTGTAPVQPGRSDGWMGEQDKNIYLLISILLVSAFFISLLLFCKHSLKNYHFLPFLISLACLFPVCAQSHVTLCLDPNIKW